jgi:hypothetical protein
MLDTPVELQQRAEELYPHDPNLQRAWLRAIEVLRATTHGWHLDRKHPPQEPKTFQRLGPVTFQRHE